MPKSQINIAEVDAALTLLSGLTAKDLLAVSKAHMGITDKVKAALSQPHNPEAVKAIHIEEQRVRKNASQQAFRATPEGRMYANEASKKSLAAKKHTEAVKAMLVDRVAVYFDTLKLKEIANQK